jgi:acyl-CoA thioester hydrolase
MRRRKTYFERIDGGPDAVRVRVERQVQLSEVDVLGIVWHGRYPAYFEQASEALGRKCGLTYGDYRSAGIGAPLVQFHIDYFRPLKLGEIFTTQASFIWTEAVRLNTEFEITGDDGACACTGFTTQLFIHLETGEPIWMPPELWERFVRRWQSGGLSGQ